MTTQTVENVQKRRIPFRNRITPDEAIAAIKAHAGQLSLAGDALGCSRGSMEQMVRRYPRVAKAMRDAEARMTDIAVAQMHQLVRARDFRATAYWLSNSRIARERGWAAPANAQIDGQPRQITEIIWRVIDTAAIKPPADGGPILEHQALEHDDRTAADL